MTRYFGAHTLEGEWHSLLPRYVLLSDRIEGKQVLDIGCGTGIGSSLLLEMGAQRVNAVDHRPEVLELARVKHAKQGLDFHVMFWEELDFPDDSFDMVLCLDPESPVTDPALLQEIKRVLRPGGEYICAIERRNVDGLESLLPRYGYEAAGKNVELSGSGERVPQLGELEQLFETVVSVVQRPQYSFIFDFAPEDEAPHTMRRSAQDSDESGLWVGENPHPEQGSAEQTDNRPGRWISIDRRLSTGEGQAAAVELLFCGDEHMPPPTLREVRMPYRGLVDRLHQLFSDLQLRQHPDQSEWVDDGAPRNQFMEREQTSEFRAVGRNRQQAQHPAHRGASAPTQAQAPAPDDEWLHMREQLHRMTRLYEEVRSQMEDLFVQTRHEIEQRDRYIEQLVDTVHHQHHRDIDDPKGDETDPESASDNESQFDRQTTSIFRRDDINRALAADGDNDSGEELETEATSGRGGASDEADGTAELEDRIDGDGNEDPSGQENGPDVTPDDEDSENGKVEGDDDSGDEPDSTDSEESSEAAAGDSEATVDDSDATTEDSEATIEDSDAHQSAE